MKVHKVDDVRFRVEDASADASEGLSRAGELHISTEGVLIKEGKGFFSIPFSTLRGVQVISKEPMRLRLSSKNAVVELEGTRAEHLWALRALILPYIDGSASPRSMKSFLVLWTAGVRDLALLSSFTGGETEPASSLLDKARAEGLLDETDALTRKGRLLLTPDELALLRRMGVEA